MLVIFAASALVGVQTYNGMEDEQWVKTLDNVILGIFTAEIVLKIISETTRPWYFFYGSPTWPWNDFDLVVVLLCMPILPLGNSAAVLRMLRLARALRLARVITMLPNLQVLIYGIIGGLSSIAHTGILIALMIYIFGLCGVFFFGKNDPFHFENLALSAVTLLRCATLDNWIDVYYINYYGCESSDLYSTNETEAVMSLTYCSESRSAPVLSSAFFIVYIILAFMILLSMFVGAISISMAAGIDKIRQEAFERRKAKRAMATSKLLHNLEHGL
jgi:voltage-gated sodium channel